MFITNDQYNGLSKLNKWYRKYNHQIIEISGMVGTGIDEIINEFLSMYEFDKKEVIYLSFDQKQVIEMGSKGYHTFFIDRFIYKYQREVNMNSLKVINPFSTHIEEKWIQKVRKKIHPRYKLIIVYDSLLMTDKMLTDLSSFGLPIILIRDPMLIPIPNSYTFIRNPNIELHELNENLMKNPITFFAHKLFNNEKLKIGNYDKISIIDRKQMNLYNLQNVDMNICMTESMRNNINNTYRRKILKLNNTINIVGERLICYQSDYNEIIVNEDEKNIKLYLQKGLVGYISRCYKHREVTKYLNMDFLPDCYHQPFEELMMDRHFLNNIKFDSRQETPDHTNYFQYAYALTPYSARFYHWNKILLTTEFNDTEDSKLQKRLLYTGITRAKDSAIIII